MRVDILLALDTGHALLAGSGPVLDVMRVKPDLVKQVLKLDH